MKLRKKLVLLVPLCLVTILSYAFLICWSLAEYDSYVLAATVVYEVLGIRTVAYIDSLPLWYGKMVVWTGIGLAFIWVCIATIFIIPKKKRSENEE